MNLPRPICFQRRFTAWARKARELLLKVALMAVDANGLKSTPTKEAVEALNNAMTAASRDPYANAALLAETTTGEDVRRIGGGTELM
jgi:hypothetical protein